MRKILVICLAFLSVFSVDAAKKKNKTPKKQPVSATVLVEASTGKILYSENAQRATPPASLTKIITLLIVFDEIKKGNLQFTDQLPISYHAAKQAPCKLNLHAGRSISLKDAVLAMVTHSANDAAVTIAEKISGSERKFATRMTAKARELGLSNTVFKNASGLPSSGQITTAYDMALLGIQTLAKYKDFLYLFSSPSFTYHGITYKNHNYRLLKNKKYQFDGIKTGFVNASGFNVVSCFKNDGKRYVAVQMGGSSPAARDKRLVEIIDFVLKKGE